MIDRINVHEPQDETWKENAKCRNSGEDFFPFDYGRDHHLTVWKKAELKRIQESLCFVCPVQRECFFYAYATKVDGGIWGGELFGHQTTKTRTRNQSIERRWEKVEQTSRQYRESIAFTFPGERTRIPQG